ncbi:MAG TPA: hypothetical protein ENK57_21215 [Polyangiaceae bacterium]|nr:hypothetical protein [Polyangiaceae bacterium]
MPESWDLRYSRQGAPKVPPPVPAARPPRGGPRLTIVLGVLAVVAATVGAGAVAWYLTTPVPAPVPEPTAAVTETASSPATAGHAPSAAATAAAAASATASATASAAPGPPPPPEDERACFAQLMPEDAFGETAPDLKGACTGRSAYATTLVLKSAVVAAGGNGVTEAMREWSKLGWYETAAFAAMRAHCCPDAEALTVSDHFGVCQLEEALAYITNAIDDEAEMKEALDDYHDAVMCLTGKGWANAFGRGGPPYGGEKVYFERVMDRIDKARGR